MAQAAASSGSSSSSRLPTLAPRRADFSHWHALCELVAHMLVLPVVCMSVCSAMGLLLGLECIEKLPPAIGAAMERVLGPVAVRSDDSGRENAATDDDGDAGATRRPLKKQRAATDVNTAASNARFGSSSSAATATETDPLAASPLVHKALARRPPAGAALKRRVVIWDLDETLVLFASLYTGAFAQKHGKEVATGVQLGEQMMTFMLVMLERHFFFDDLHDADIDHIDCLRKGGSAGASAVDPDSAESGAAPRVSPAELAARYARIRAIYERDGAVDFLSDERSEWFAICETLVAAIDAFSMGWLHEARQVLELLAAPSLISGRSNGAAATQYENINLLVTNTQLAPALCKCLIYKLDAYFPIESVYSSAKVHKQHCFEQIIRAYTAGAAGDCADVEFIAVGDGAEEEHVSRVLGIRFHKIHSLADLQRLRFDLELVSPAQP